jgi:hypothetical protein
MRAGKALSGRTMWGKRTVGLLEPKKCKEEKRDGGMES